MEETADAMRQWLEAARDAGIDAIAVTDHNTAEAISLIQNVASKVDAVPVVFPGVELTASNGCHLLLLMDPSCNQQHVDDLLSRVGVPVDDRGKQTARSPLSVENILDECGDNALVIGAHVNGSDDERTHSLLHCGGMQRIEVLRNAKLAGVEVQPDLDCDETWLDGSKPEVGRKLSQVWGSDSHSLDRIGQRFTWVKMTKPNLEGLRLALLDGEASLKPARRGDVANPNSHANQVIESITIHEGKLIGRNTPTSVCFNPWLNAIIGGRGTGKSTLVDFCRIVLRRDRELDGAASSRDESLREVFDRRMRVATSRTDDGLLRENSRMEVVYRKDGERFLLSWSQDGAAQSIVRLRDNEHIPEDGNITERFPVRIYSQKQLFALAQDPNALLTVIDDVQAVQAAGSERRMNQLENEYLTLRLDARAAAAQASELPNIQASLNDVRRKLEVIQQGGHAQILSAYRTRRQTNDTWNAILEATGRGLDLVSSAVDELSVAELDIGVESEDDAPRAAMRRAHQSLNRLIAEFRQSVAGSIAEVERQLTEVRAGADANEWSAAVRESEAEFENTVARLAEEGISDPTEYGALVDQATRLEAEIGRLTGERQRVATLEAQAEEVLTRYRGERGQLNARRREFAKSASGDALRVEVNAYAAHSSLADDLEGILGIQRFQEDRGAIAGRIWPQDNGQWDWNRLDAIVAEMRRFHSGMIDLWDTHDARFKAALRGIPPERIDRLALYLPEDTVSVRFRDAGSSNDWRSLSQGSPGQQTAALLAFVLGFGNEPIILDQPEDDLDSTLIYELLVNRFRELKATRQMIVVTHNPNIVVHGDAEYVVSLDVPNGETTVRCSGGLQEISVRDEICRVMEGGREAFQSRYHRIISPTGAE
jgi:energy-coupling factor transporter ATP-binding protein EcfA2